MKAGSRPFRLTRYFVLTSLLGAALLLPALLFYNRHLAFQSLLEHESRANVALTKTFANTVWSRYAGFVAGSSGLGRDQLLARPEIEQMRVDVLRQMHGTLVAKIKLYNLDGLTVFSTDPKQIGEDKSKNGGFLRAKSGGVASNITFRAKFDAFEGELSDRNLIASYIPVRQGEAASVEGVFEVYSDVTGLVADIERTQRQIILGLFTGLACLYLFLFYIVRRADRILKAQERERAASEERIRVQAYHDALTGLPNRTNFVERLDEAIKQAKRTDGLVAVMFLDLDRFKLVNDSLGHDAGDRLLKIVAGLLTDCVRDSDSVFRMGGDEFTILLKDIKQPQDAAYVAQRVLDSFSEPVAVLDHEVAVGASIGISIYPTDDRVPEKLIKDADAAMYLVKDSGRGRYEFYSREISSLAMERLEIQSGLQRALRRDEFLLHYQPRVETSSFKIVAAEALIRWRHPTLGLLAPHRFIDLLEDTGFIVAVGEWVLRSACTQAKSWERNGPFSPRVSVNISSRQFRSGNFLEVVRQILDDTGLSPDKLELELTETALVHNAELAATLLEKVRELGVRISIDDFGAGYSSLIYLKRFPVDFLKLDRALVMGLTENNKDAAIAIAVASLAQSLGIDLVAEGVDRVAQARFLAKQHCREMQGFLFGKPVCAEEFESLLADPHQDQRMRLKAVAG